MGEWVASENTDDHARSRNRGTCRLTARVAPKKEKAQKMQLGEFLQDTCRH